MENFCLPNIDLKTNFKNHKTDEAKEVLAFIEEDLVIYFL